MWRITIWIVWFISMILLLSSCGHTRRPGTRAIVHDYVIIHAVNECANNDGLHYIVTDRYIETRKDTRYPCDDKYVFSCQDGTKIKYNSGTRYCFISEEQIKESFGE